MEQLFNVTNWANMISESNTPVVMTLGAVIGLALAIFMILKKIHPAYSLMAGAFVGGVIGLVWNHGLDSLQITTGFMLSGAQGLVPATIRILTAGVLAGILIKSGAAARIAEKITSIFPGEKGAIFALALAAMILTAVGVFIDVAVITVGPIALATAKKTKLPVMALLLAMIGGGKAGNMLSPNPNAIAASEAFEVDLGSIMVANIPAALVGLGVAFVLSLFLAKKFKGTEADVEVEVEEESNEDLPEFWAAILGPIVTIILLSLRPIFDIVVDPLIALPVGGLVGVIAMGKLRHTNEYITFGLSRMGGIAILLLATGTLAGIIQNSGIQEDLIAFLEWARVPLFLLAPISGILFSAATASTTAGVAVSGAAFAPTIMESVSPLAGAAMVHTGATVLDHLPHGSFFHATGGVANLEIKNRLKLIPYETLVGLAMTIVSTIMWGVIIG